METDLERSKVRLWSAGHPPALLWRSSERRTVALSTSSLPLGMFPTWQGDPEEMDWQPGDVLLLYTDGLTEARNARGEMFTNERVAEALTVGADGTASMIIRSLLTLLEAWGTPSDDLTIVVLKRTGTG